MKGAQVPPACLPVLAAVPCVSVGWVAQWRYSHLHSGPSQAGELDLFMVLLLQVLLFLQILPFPLSSGGYLGHICRVLRVFLDLLWVFLSHPLSQLWHVSANQHVNGQVGDTPTVSTCLVCPTYNVTLAAGNQTFQALAIE